MYRADGRPWWEVPTGYPHTSDSSARPTNAQAEEEDTIMSETVSNLLCLSAAAFQGGAPEHAALFEGYLSTLSATSPIVPTTTTTTPSADVIASHIAGDYTPQGLRRVEGLLSASAQIWKELPDVAIGGQQQDTARNVVVGLVDAAIQKQQMVLALLLLKASGIAPKQYLSHTKAPKALQLFTEVAVSTIITLTTSPSTACPAYLIDASSPLGVGWVLQNCASPLLDSLKTSIDALSTKVIPSVLSIPSGLVLRRVVAVLIKTIWIPIVQDTLLAAASIADPSTTGIPSYVKLWTLVYTLTKTANTLDATTTTEGAAADHTLQIVRRSIVNNRKSSYVQLHEVRNVLEFETPKESAKFVSIADEGRIAVNKLIRLSVPNLLDGAAGSTQAIIPNVSTAVFAKEYAVDDTSDNAASRQVQLNGLLHTLLVSDPVGAWTMILDRSVTLPCLSTSRATTSTSDMSDFDQFTGDSDTRTSSRFRCFYETITGVFSATGAALKPCGNAALTATTNDPAMIMVNKLLFYFNMVEQVLSATLGAVLTAAILGKESPSSSPYTPHQKEQAEAIRILMIASLDEALLSLNNTRFSGPLVASLVTVYGLRTAPGAPMQGIPHSALLSLWANQGSEVPAAYRVREMSEGSSPRYSSLREEWNYAISRSCIAISQSHQWSHTILPLTLLAALGCHGAATTAVSTNPAFFAILNAGSSDVAARAALASAMPLPLFSRFTAAAEKESTPSASSVATSVAHALSQDAVNLLRMPLTGRVTPDLLTALLDAASEAAVLVSLYRSNLLPQAYLKDTNPAMIDSACALFYAFLSLLRCQGLQVSGGQSAAESRLALLRRMECAVEMALAEVGTRFGVAKASWRVRVPASDAAGTDAQSACPFMFWGLLSATEYALLAELRTERHSSMRAEEDTSSTDTTTVGLKRQSTSNASLRVQLQPSETLLKHMNSSYAWMVMRSIHTLSATSPSHLGSIATKATSALPAHALVQLWRFNDSFTPLDSATWASLATKGETLDTLVKGRCKDLPGDFVTETANIVQAFANSQINSASARSLDAQADIEAFYTSSTTDVPSAGVNLLWTSIKTIRAPSPITPTEELISAEHHFADVRVSSQYAAIASLFQCILSKALLCPREALFASVLLRNLLKGMPSTTTSTTTTAAVEEEGADDNATKDATDEAAPSTLLGALANKYAEDDEGEGEGEGEEEEDQEDDHPTQEEATKDAGATAEEATTTTTTPASPKADAPKAPTYPLHFVTLCALRDVFLVSGLRQLFSGTKRDAQCLSVFFELLVNKVLIPWCEGGATVTTTTATTATVFTTPNDTMFPALPAAGTDTSMEFLRMLIANVVKGYEITLSEPSKVSCCGLTAALFAKRRLSFVMGWLRRHRNYVLWAEGQMAKNISRITCGLTQTYAENTYLSCKGIEMGAPPKPKVPETPASATPTTAKPAVVNKLARAVSAVVATNAAAGVAPISNDGVETLSEIYPKLTAVLGIPLSPPLSVALGSSAPMRRRSASPDQSRRPPMDSRRDADRQRDVGRDAGRDTGRRGVSPRGTGDKRPRSPARGDDHRDERPPRRDDPRDDRRDADRRDADRRDERPSRRDDPRDDPRDDRRGVDRRDADRRDERPSRRDDPRDDRRDADRRDAGRGDGPIDRRGDDRRLEDRRGRDDRRDADRRRGDSPRRGDNGRDDRRPSADKPPSRGGRDDRRGGGGGRR